MLDIIMFVCPSTIGIRLYYIPTNHNKFCQQVKLVTFVYCCYVTTSFVPLHAYCVANSNTNDLKGSSAWLSHFLSAFMVQDALLYITEKTGKC